jgi:hypothetical protein
MFWLSTDFWAWVCFLQRCSNDNAAAMAWVAASKRFMSTTEVGPLCLILSLNPKTYALSVSEHSGALKGYVRGAGGHTHLYVGYLYAVGLDTCLERDELNCNESLPSQACSSLNEDTIAACGQLSSDKLLPYCHGASRCCWVAHKVMRHSLLSYLQSVFL